MPMTFRTDFDTVVTSNKGKLYTVTGSYSESCRESVFGMFYDEARDVTGFSRFEGLSGEMVIRFSGSMIHRDCRIGSISRFQRVLDDLCKVYPSVTAESVAELEVFSGKSTLCVTLRSATADIVPVWWWAAVICRILLINVDADPGTVLDTVRLPDLPRDSETCMMSRSTQWDSIGDKENAIIAWTKSPQQDGLKMFNDLTGPAETHWAAQDSSEW